MGIDATKGAGFFVTFSSVSLRLLVRPSGGLRPRLLRSANSHLAGIPAQPTGGMRPQ